MKILVKCKYCGRLFNPSMRREGARTCSPFCSKAWWRHQQGALKKYPGNILRINFEEFS